MSNTLLKSLIDSNFNLNSRSLMNLMETVQFVSFIPIDCSRLDYMRVLLTCFALYRLCRAKNVQSLEIKKKNLKSRIRHLEIKTTPPPFNRFKLTRLPSSFLWNFFPKQIKSFIFGRIRS